MRQAVLKMVFVVRAKNRRVSARVTHACRAEIDVGWVAQAEGVPKLVTGKVVPATAVIPAGDAIGSALEKDVLGLARHVVANVGQCDCRRVAARPEGNVKRGVLEPVPDRDVRVAGQRRVYNRRDVGQRVLVVVDGVGQSSP